jgi:hypothetical protein
MLIQCPNCLASHIRPDPHRWFELPLVLFWVQPYQCRRCERRFLRFRWPDLSLSPSWQKLTVAR